MSYYYSLGKFLCLGPPNFNILQQLIFKHCHTNMFNVTSIFLKIINSFFSSDWFFIFTAVSFNPQFNVMSILSVFKF